MFGEVILLNVELEPPDGVAVILKDVAGIKLDAVFAENVIVTVPLAFTVDVIFAGETVNVNWADADVPV